MFIPSETNPLIYPDMYERDLVITGAVDYTVRIWSLKYSECLKILTDHNGPIHSIATNPLNQNEILTAGGDGMIICWDIITGDKIIELKGHQGAVICIMTHKNFLYSGSTDKTARSWVIEFGECNRTYNASSEVNCMQFFDGMCKFNMLQSVCIYVELYHSYSIVCTGHCDGKANLYDSKSGTLKKSFAGHSDAITGLQFSPKRIFTCCLKGKLCVWDTSRFDDGSVLCKQTIEKDDNDEDDCEIVQKALKAVDNYIR